MVVHARILATLIAVAGAVAPLAALAQAEPGARSAPPATTAPPQNTAPPSYGRADESVKGRVSSFDGAYNMQVRDERGFIDNVQLHQGTIINPTGLRLVPGMDVTVYGVNQGSVFAANEIDTPYQTVMAYPVYPPYGYGYGYPYLYPYPFGYPFSVGIHFGPGFHRGFRR
jgi:hypothetical protein